MSILNTKFKTSIKVLKIEGNKNSVVIATILS